ncbi:MAG: hemolysin family protein [Acidimicrobiales bacterium]|nr:hemolysin family protein [Acidimicrobiales bacterium]MDP6298026.1 hemolysin family protein [Acidimicrobiales bacterium]HJM28479.1 hemolysin family protein [Acidimicrobiales bacterium]HJM98233.1 hemolysin family protein [Acidimicrobiales bacterium]
MITTITAILVTILLVLFNGVFVAVEFALVAARRPKMERLAQSGNRPAKIGIELMTDLPLSISGAQLGITISSLGLGLVAEPAFAKIVEVIFTDPLGLPSSLSHAIAFGLALFIVVFLHMVLGEMVPKNFALTNSELVLCRLSRFHRSFVFIFRPVIWFLNMVSRLLLKPFGINQVAELGIAYTVQEIHTLIGEVRTGGNMDQTSHDILAGALLFQDQPVSSVMVPWRSVVSVDVDAPIGKIQTIAAQSGHSRIPMLSGDRIVGFVHVKDLLYLENGEEQLKLSQNRIREILITPSTRTLDELLREMRETQIHFALVGESDQNFQGIVTLEDVLEAIVGDIIDESDRVGIPAKS